MLKGGYQIINLENRELRVGEGSVFNGIYDKIEGTSKALLISGLNVGGIEKRDGYGYPILNETNFEINLGNLKITITDNDVVTVSEIQAGEAARIVTVNTDPGGGSDVSYVGEPPRVGDIIKLQDFCEGIAFAKNSDGILTFYGFDIIMKFEDLGNGKCNIRT